MLCLGFVTCCGLWSAGGLTGPGSPAERLRGCGRVYSLLLAGQRFRAPDHNDNYSGPDEQGPAMGIQNIQVKTKVSGKKGRTLVCFSEVGFCLSIIFLL